MATTAGESIGSRIRQLRGDLTQRELADAAGGSVEVIRKLEQEIVQGLAEITGSEGPHS